VHANGEPVGTITDIEDSTENALFVINRPDGQPAYIPIADELIDEINPEERYIVMTLPEGILDL
ncbi:PRC-barrel domain-containing protein, partial [uncultured Muribaculum sp.]